MKVSQVAQYLFHILRLMSPRIRDPMSLLSKLMESSTPGETSVSACGECLSKQ